MGQDAAKEAVIFAMIRVLGDVDDFPEDFCCVEVLVDLHLEVEAAEEPVQTTFVHISPCSLLEDASECDALEKKCC